MSLFNFSGESHTWTLQSWILGIALWMVTGPVLGQEGWGFSSQPAVAARAAVLMNPVTGEVLFAKEPHLRLPPASTTKVLTALVALERLNPNARLLVSPQAASAAPSRIGLHAGEAVTTQDLLYGLLLKSGNDAAETLAEGAGGSIYGFANLMNAKAWQIGARNSHFMNPHGLPDDDHYSTAYDLALIFRYAMYYPMFADIVRTRNAALRIESGRGWYGDWRMVPVRNTNRLLASYEGARGGKTGFTLKARRCFVGEVDRGGVRLIVAILNSPTSGTLWQDARNLLNYGFSRYGLAPPPPVQVEPELEPILVRRVPSVTTPATTRVAMAWSAAEEEPEPVVARRAPTTRGRAVMAWSAAEEEPEPVVARRVPVTTRTTARAAVARPAVVTERKRERAVAKTKTLAASVKPTAPAKAKAVTPAKATLAKSTSTQSTVAKSSTRAKSTVAKSTVVKIPIQTTAATSKPTAAKTGKTGKPATVAVVKPDKRAVTKVAARAEPVGAKPSQKNAKRRI